MRIDAIRSFVKLVETGSYTAAAAEMYMSTTTVHSHVRSLESDLQAELVAFSRRRLQLTHAGNLFLIFAERTLREYDRLQEEIARRSRSSATSLRIAGLPAISVYILPPVVRAFVEQRPDVHPVIDTRRTGETLATMATGEADVAVVLDTHAQLPPEEFDVTEIMETHSALVVRADLDTGKLTPMEILSSFPLSAQPAANLYRQHLERWVASHGVTIDVRFEHSAYDGIISDVFAGDYVGLVTNYVRMLNPRANELRELEVPGFGDSHMMVAIHPKRTTPTAREFVDFLADFCRDQLFRGH